MTTLTPRTPAPERPPPPVPPPHIEPPPPDPSPSPPAEEFHTPTPSFEASTPEEYGSANDGTPMSTPEEYGSANDGTAIAKSPQLSPVRFPTPSRLPVPESPTANNGQDGRAATPSPARQKSRPELRLAAGLVRTPSPSPSPSPPSPLTPAPAPTAKPPSPSPSPPSPLTPAAPAAKSPALSLSPPSPLTPAAPAAKSPALSLSPPSPLTPAPAAKLPSPSPSPQIPAHASAVNSSVKSAPKHAEAWKPPLSPLTPAANPVQFDPVEEAVTSPLRLGKRRLDQQRRTPAAAGNGGVVDAEVPPDVAAVAKVGERRALSVALRLATAVLSLAAFSVIVSARTSGWAGDYFSRHGQYRYAVGVNLMVCAYSILQSVGEIRRLIAPRFIFRSMSSYYCSLFLDQVLAYLLMSASSAAASRNDLWVSRFGTDAFNKKINSAVWLSFIAFLMLALNALISTANLFSVV